MGLRETPGVTVTLTLHLFGFVPWLLKPGLFSATGGHRRSRDFVVVSNSIIWLGKRGVPYRYCYALGECLTLVHRP